MSDEIKAYQVTVEHDDEQFALTREGALIKAGNELRKSPLAIFDAMVKDGEVSFVIVSRKNQASGNPECYDIERIEGEREQRYIDEYRMNATWEQDPEDA